jgi:[ribosomal protein S5]-alanine N-acetyltransferase
MENNVFIKGDTIILRPLQEEDIIGNYNHWLNNPETTMYNSHGRFPFNNNSLLDYIKSHKLSTTSIVLAIVDINSQNHIGNVSLQSINWIDRSAEIAFLLGESNFRGKGVMYEVGKLMINHAFKMLNLHRVYCGTSSNNIAMQKLAIKLGMCQEGVRKEAIFNQGTFFDILEYGLLSKDFIK